jgi:hypothetical protein
VATFTDQGGVEPNPADPSGNINNHYKVVSIDWGDGSPLDTTTGALSYSGMPGSKTAAITVSGTHTHAAAGNYTITVKLDHEGAHTTVTSFAPVANLGLYVQGQNTKPSNWWAGILGRELINSFGPTSSGLSLANWLAATFPNLYGVNAGANNLTGKSNAQVAAFYLTLFNMHAALKLDAKVLNTALDVFASTRSLGGGVAQNYGFLVNSVGLGAYLWNIVYSGAAFGVPNFTVLNVYQILQATNKFAVDGKAWGMNALLRNKGYSVFSGIDGDGGSFI